MDWSLPNRRGYYEKNSEFICRLSPLGDALAEDPVQVMFSGGVAAMRRLIGELRALSEGRPFSIGVTEYAARDFALVDVNAPGCSKGSALAAWSDAQRIGPGAVLAAGDNLNDLDMLAFAGTPVVMGNAPDEVKRTPRAHVTGTNDEGGLAAAIARFVLGPRAG
jgi:hydroxymethylpyrimidine pyrophosphatase-like HAD family hydrolase